MKKKLTIICLALWLGAVVHGDLGNSESKKITVLDQDEVDKYYTEHKVVGRDQSQGQCPQHVLDQRKVFSVIFSLGFPFV